MRELNYVHNRRAASFRAGESHEVGLLIHNIVDPFHAEVTKGVNSYFEERRFLIYLLDAENDLDRQTGFLQATMEGGAAGLLWCPTPNTTEETVDWVAASGVPTVTLLNLTREGLFDHVSVDNFLGAKAAARHLCELGHRNIAFLGGIEGSATRRARYEGYSAALTEAGIPVMREYSRAFVADRGEAVRHVIELLTAHPEITAVFGNDDTVAFGAMMGMRRIGLTPGQDVAVTGFNDISEAAHWTPSLTTVSVNPHGIGVELAKTLLERRAEPHKPPQTTLLPVQLVVRESTGPCKTN